jgi:hypothetical protein
MAWTEVETPNAKYVLAFGAHRSETILPNIKFDSVILEGPSTYIQGIINHTQFGGAVRQAAENNLPIFITDCKESNLEYVKSILIPFVQGVVAGGIIHAASKQENVTRRGVLKTIGWAGLLSVIGRMAGIAALGKYGGRLKNDKLVDVAGRVEEFHAGKGQVLLRNALSAEKAESFVAPLLRKELGRKPTILMAWGGGHMGIKRWLQNSAERKKVLRETRLEGYLRDFRDVHRISIRANERTYETKSYRNVLRIEQSAALQIQPPRVMNRRQFFAALSPRKRNPIRRV